MRDVARLLSMALSALAMLGCFPEYSVADDGGGGTGGEPTPVPMMYLDTQGQDFQFTFTTPGDPDPVSHTATVHFTHDVEIDQLEVTVERFNQWWYGEQNAPCPECPLDEGGPYANMKWHESWDALVDQGQFHWSATEGISGTCSGPSPYPADPPHRTTWQMVEETDAPGSLPMTCVTWPQAVAYCASQHKRLPTLAEWLWARRHLPGGQTFPWGNALPSSCEQVTYEPYDPPRCGFPKPGGTTGDETLDGVKDMVGSVFEWTWDTEWPDDNGGENYSGPDAPDLGPSHFRAGGAYISDVDDQRLVDQIQPFGPGDHYNDAGFRCAQTVK